jgi:DnaJ-class molecular chaperone
MQTRTLSVKIPAGVREGQFVRLAGQGMPGYGGGENGDLYLEIRFKPHPQYRVDGRDLYMTLPVAPWEAALGASRRNGVSTAWTCSARWMPGAWSGISAPAWTRWR